MAVAASALFNTQIGKGPKSKPKDFLYMLNAREQTLEEMMAVLRNATIAMGGSVN